LNTNYANTKAELARFLDGIPVCAGVIWDFDGTIVDSEPVQSLAYRAVLEEYGVSPSTSFFQAYIGHTETEIWKGLSHDYSLSESFSSLIKQRSNKLETLLVDRTPPNWFVRPMLEYLRQRAVKSVIVSSGNESLISLYLRYWDLLDEFESISATDLAKNVAPKAVRLTAAIAALNVGTAVVVEDSAAYLKLARDAGAATIGVSHSLNGSEIADHSDAQVSGSVE
jgi:tRNA (adenine57-N1/adenine58-N1)-methyltransferase